MTLQLKIMAVAIGVLLGLTFAASAVHAAQASGSASWYGGKFHGRMTASGERFNQNAYTAAHRTLKFGTRVCVRNRRNGAGVTVRINDRGPWTKGRIIDVSKAAASRLGMVRSGTAKVNVQIVERSAKPGRAC